MKKMFFAFLFINYFVAGNYLAFAEPKVTIVEPANRADVSSPVKVCMEIKGMIVEPASKGVNPGKGHHHILFSSLPVDLSKPLGKEEIHLRSLWEKTPSGVDL